MNKIFAFILKLLTPLANLLRVPADKLAHVLIAFVCVAFGWLTGFAPAGVALAVIFAFVKEWVIDDTPDWEDFWFTVGAAVVAYLFTLAL